MPLEGKTALVTAASRNLGPAIAERLARGGATVAISYVRSQAEAQALVERLRAGDGRGHGAFRADTGSVHEVRRLVETAAEHLGGRIDVLVNNAGPWGADPYLELAPETWDHVMDTNVKATYLASRLAAPAMKEGGWGRVVNIAAGSMYLRNHSVYALAKNAVGFLTEQLAVELGPEITVNAVSPGQIEESAPDISEFDPTFVPRAIAQTPVGRLVRRAEIAEMVALLCEPAFDTVTGATIPMDGGWRFHRF